MLLAWLKGQMGHKHTLRHKSASCCRAGLKDRWVHCVVMAARLQLCGGGHVDIERTLAGSGVQKETLAVECHSLLPVIFPISLSLTCTKFTFNSR